MLLGLIEMSKRIGKGTCLKASIFMVLGFFCIGVVFFFFREGIVFKDNSFNLDENFLYKVCLGLFLLLSVLVAFRLLFLSYKINGLSKKIIKGRNQQSNYIYSIMEKSGGVFHSIWQSYAQTFSKMKNSAGTRETRSDADLYFNAEDIANKSFFGLPALELLKGIPGAFIGLGILGTFIGFTNAIPESSHFSSIDELKPLLSGLKVAFNTSIFGILSSVIYTFFIAQPITHSLENNTRELSDLIDSDHYISDVEVSRRGLEDFEKLIKGFQNDYVQKIIAVTTELSKITERLRDTPTEIEKINERLNANAENIYKITSQQLHSVFESIKKTISAMNKVHTHFDETASIVRESCNDIRSIPNNVAQIVSDLLKEVLENSFNEVKIRISEGTSELEQFTKENISQSFGGFGQFLVEKVEVLTNELISSNRTLIEQNNKLLLDEIEGIASSISSFEKNIVSISDSTELIPGEITKIYDDLSLIPAKLKELQDEFMTSSEQLINSSGLTDAIGKIKDLNDGLTKRELTLQGLMNRSGNKFKAASESVESVAATMEKISERMESARVKIDSSNTAMTLSMRELLKCKSNEEIKIILEKILSIVEQLNQAQGVVEQ